MILSMSDANFWLQPNVTWIWTDTSLLGGCQLGNWAAEHESGTATNSGGQPFEQGNQHKGVLRREWQKMDTWGWLGGCTTQQNIVGQEFKVGEHPSPEWSCRAALLSAFFDSRPTSFSRFSLPICASKPIMDRLWKGPAFQAHQFSDFHFVDFDKKEDLSGPQPPPSSVSDDLEESPPWSPPSVVHYMPDDEDLGSGYKRSMHSREVDGEAEWAKVLNCVNWP